MDYIERISNQYKGEISLHDPYIGKTYENITKEIYSILRINNGISETMRLSGADEKPEIGWILYSHKMLSLSFEKGGAPHCGIGKQLQKSRTRTGGYADGTFF